MTAGARLAAFAIVLGLAAGGGAVAGAVIGPTPDEGVPADGDGGHDMGSDMEQHSGED